MIKFNFIDNRFFKNIATLATGTIISQLILIISSPLLSRLYAVESFGKLAIFSSITSFFAVFSTGRYELAIGLPNNDDDSYKLIKLVFIIGSIISLFFLILLVLLKYILNYDDGIGFLSQGEAIIAPFYIFVISVHSALTYWFQRNKKYKLIAFSNAIQIISTTIIGLIFGHCFNFQGGMTYSLFLGMILSCLFYLTTDNNLFYNVIKQKNIIIQLKKYINFPKFSTFSDLSLVASQQFTPIVFSLLYNTTIVGFFSFANRIIRLPNIVVTNAVGNVFRNEAIDEIRLQNNCRELFLTTLKKLLIISLPIYFVLFISAPCIFSMVFGEAWYIAGEFAQIISIFLFFEFVSTPLNILFNISGRQKSLMILQILNAVTGGISLFLGYYFFRDEYISLLFFTLNSCLFSTFFIFKTYSISKLNLKYL